MREWCTLPYALAMSSQATARDLFFCLADWIMVDSFAWCSVTPGTVGRKAFCKSGFR